MNRVSTPRVSPVWLVLIGILSVQLGAVISKGLFGEILPLGMVFLRLITSSLILLAPVRPPLRGRPSPTGGRCWRRVRARRDERGALRVVRSHPARCSVTIEFVGQLFLGAVGSRRPVPANPASRRLQSDEAAGAAGTRDENSATAWARSSMSTGLVR